MSHRDDGWAYQLSHIYDNLLISIHGDWRQRAEVSAKKAAAAAEMSLKFVS